jgi:hypothetical protein
MTLTMLGEAASLQSPMKRIPAICAIASLGLVACDTLNGPVSSGGFNPLLPAGGSNSPTQSPRLTYTAGQFVRAAINNTAFFKSRPNANANADADKLLKRGTSMKVVSISNSYVKVELDSGEIGFVPTVMIEDPQAPTPAASSNPNEYQVYPPLPNASLDRSVPIINPAETPPGGAIPTVIDPDTIAAPATPPLPTTPVEPVTPPPPPTVENLPDPVPSVEIKGETNVTPTPAAETE